ncbi:hypothetical protein Aspvir_003324 [Aspergillus viridinutans]|uniref:Uncharacterized protein n=1 Tax=Aspergillus viridinutans TaxID=75553 RepID=A0A9P3C3Z7_ASPVI|nr:uncharacterized protein Aspvir_003324 [Aspergillus viridinutans]GIK07658.1 hypothetical protein Aspvir_003324 [Aspergillus viridinutans]
MGVSQIQASFQNDGNFSQLDLQDIQEPSSPIMRIETFRCSQPQGEFGITSAGTDVVSLAGKDHLLPTSNKTFRHVFSYGAPQDLKALLEMRETFEEDGAFEVKMRDIDGRSTSFGSTLVASAKPKTTGVAVNYKFLAPRETLPKKVIKSPLEGPLTVQINTLVDIADVDDNNTIPTSRTIAVDLIPKGDTSAAIAELSTFSSAIQQEYPQWTENMKLFTTMGDFRDKTIHPGQNLATRNSRAADYMMIRPYRVSLIMAGRLFDSAMSAGANQINSRDPLALDAKPGVYNVFLSAFASNIGLYQLAIDKAHSDYGGVPMALKPGSRLENGSHPVIDATNLNRNLALISAIYFAPDALPPILASRPSISVFPIPPEMPLFASRA